MLSRQLASPNTLLAAGNWVMVVGLAVSALAGLAALVALVPGRSMTLLSAAMSGVFLEALFSYNSLGARLTAPEDASTFTIAALQLAGLVVMIVVGILAVVGRKARVAATV
jgi:hypothetical protein